MLIGKLLWCLQTLLLNQERDGHRPVYTWFLKIDPLQIVGMHACVCLRPRLLITSGIMWHDMKPV